MKKALFICLKGLHRSRTAAEIFKSWPNCQTKWAGSESDEAFPLQQADIEWATIIFVMEGSQQKKLKKRFGELLTGKRIICLNIPDIFEFGDEGLKRLLEGKTGRHLTIN